jgi:predicted RNase H-like HicB family nuclease
MNHIYAVMFEKTKTGYGAWAPDLPGCVATGRTLAITRKLMREAIALHLARMKEDGIPAHSIRGPRLNIVPAAVFSRVLRDPFVGFTRQDAQTVGFLSLVDEVIAVLIDELHRGEPVGANSLLVLCDELVHLSAAHCGDATN